MGIIPCVILNYNAVFGDVRFRDAHAHCAAMGLYLGMNGASGVS